MQDQKDKIINLEDYLGDPAVLGEIASVRLKNILHKESFVVIRDPRVTAEDNDRYLDMMERYFSQPEKVLRKDQRPKLHYQVGVSKGQEKPRDHRAYISTMPVQDWPHITPLNYADPRWRFFRNLGSPPPKTRFPKLNAQRTPVIPAGFEGEWAQTMDAWGNKMLASIYTIAEMIAVAFNLPPQTFTDYFHNAPHLIAPNGVNLLDYPKGTVFNGFHYDLNWGTIHGRSRFPGLRAWPRTGSPFTVRVPEGCLLFQVAKQLEWQTGGYFLAGFHEVVSLPETIAAARKAVRSGRVPIRVSSTVFAHVASDTTLHVIEELCTSSYLSSIQDMYPPILAGNQVLQELEAIGLKK